MRSVSLRLVDLERKPLIPLGFEGENEYMTINFDCKTVFDKHPTAIPTLAVTPPKGDSYPAVVVRDGDIVSWTVCDSDLVYPGEGELQLTFVDGTIIGKTYKARTKVLDSITPSGEAPTPIQNWLIQAAAALQALPTEVASSVAALMGAMVGVGETLDPDDDVTVNYDPENNTLTIGVPHGRNGEDGHTPTIAAEKVGKVATFYVDGVAIVQISDGQDADPTALIDDTSTAQNRTWSAKKLDEEKQSLKTEINSMSTATASAVGKALSPKTVTNGKVVEWQFKPIEGGSGAEMFYVTPEQYGAEGDGITDDSQAVQDAVDAGYAVYFGSNKSYYIPTTVTIEHDCHLFGGENTKIITKTPTGGELNNVFVVKGTNKKTTTLTTDYTTKGSTDNSGNRFTLSDMTGINIGDIMVITATDQYYNYSRQYYYLGATLLIGDIYDGHIYTTSSMPWDIELTANVTVEIYDAPVAIIENLHFEADMDSHGNYKHFIVLSMCKNSVIKNCDFTMMDCGINVNKCVNTFIDSIEMSKSEETEIQGDGYGLYIGSSTNTIVQRMMAICSQAGISLSGTIPNMDTFIRNCQLGSECRRHGIAMHENSYNAVIEDCTLAGLNVLGTGIVNRCRFVKNNRSTSSGGITFCGSHNPKYASLKVNDCIFESINGIYVSPSSPQNPVQSYDNIIGLIEVKNCKGGMMTIDGSVTQTVLSNIIKKLLISNWTECEEIYRTNASFIIEKMAVSNCLFNKNYWINNHGNAFLLENVYDLNFASTFPMQHKIVVHKDVLGERYTLPENVKINLSATNSSTAKYIICGNNLASNDPDDYVIGSVSGSDGGTLTRTPSTASSRPTITTDSDGNIVYTQKNNTNNFSMYPVGMFYAREYMTIKMSAKIKSSDAVKFKPYIAIVNCETGKLVSRFSGTTVEATSSGAEISFAHGIEQNHVAMCYYYCSTAVANASITFEDMAVVLENKLSPSEEESIQPYEARRLTGDGSIMSLPGINNIMSSEDIFHVAFEADYVENPIGLLPNGMGVSF